MRKSYPRIGIYHEKTSDGSHHFKFFLGEDSKKSPPIKELQTNAKLTRELQAAIKRDDYKDIGFINFTLERQSDSMIVAKSRYYWPKRVFGTSELKVEKPEGEWPAAGLGAFLEAHCCEHLKKFGVTHVSTGPNPSYAREISLQKKNLPIKTPVPIDEWIAKLRSE